MTHFILSHVGILELAVTLWFHHFILGLCTLLSIGVGELGIFPPYVDMAGIPSLATFSHSNKSSMCASIKYSLGLIYLYLNFKFICSKIYHGCCSPFKRSIASIYDVFGKKTNVIIIMLLDLCIISDCI